MLRRVLLGLVSVSFVACDSTGLVRFNTSGGQAIEGSIPSDSMGFSGFVDGWVLKYSTFQVPLKELTIRDVKNAVLWKQDQSVLFDLVGSGPFVVDTSTPLYAGRYAFSYAIGPTAGASPATGSGVSADDVSFMEQRGYSIYVKGTATRAATATSVAVTKTFEWGFATDTLYTDCTSNGASGVKATSGITETVELTVRGEHLFFDDLKGDGAKLRFDAIADADKAPNDGKVTLEELNAVQLSSLVLSPYRTNDTPNVNTLKDFLTALTRSVGHFKGDGECTAVAR